MGTGGGGGGTSDCLQQRGTGGGAGSSSLPSPPTRHMTSDRDMDLPADRQLNTEMYGQSSSSMATITNGNGGGIGGQDLHSRALLRAVVGYLGTVDTPADSHLDSTIVTDCLRLMGVTDTAASLAAAATAPHSPMQTTILLAIYQDCIQLVDIMGRSVAKFGADSLKWCGICSDNRKYFAIIMSSNTTSIQNHNNNNNNNNCYSCHVFHTNLSTHETHYKIAHNFGIKCTLDPISTHCLEFPESSDSILRMIVGLYRQTVGCAPLALTTNVSASSTMNSGSNSDSGITEENSRSPDTAANNNNLHLHHNHRHNHQQQQHHNHHQHPPQHHQHIGRNKSYNSQRLDGQLDAANVRQTVSKYLSLTGIGHHQHPNAATQQQQHGLETESSLNNNDDNNGINGNTNDKNSHPLPPVPTESSAASASDTTTIVSSKSATDWSKPATLSKENLELNNEITSSGCCYHLLDAKLSSSMSLEGIAPMSDTVSAASASVVSERPVDVGWVGGWAQHFEKLLNDCVGVRAFTEFLKKEYSYENLQFWLSCQKYKQLATTAVTDNNDPTEQLKLEAKLIYDQHLASGAPEPVNIDGRSRLIVESTLDDPTPNLFETAEKQIYSLMKFDCYQRFLKSDIFKECVALELQGKPLPYETTSGGNFNAAQLNTIKPKKRSFIPWHRIRTSKAEKQMLKQANAKHTYIRCKSTEPIASNKSSDFTGSQSSLTTATSDRTNGGGCGGDGSGGRQNMAFMSKSNESLNKLASIPPLQPTPTTTTTTTISSHSTNSSNGGHNCHHNCTNNDCHLLCVILPDRSQSFVPVVDGQTVGQMVDNLLEKRGLNYTAFDAFITTCDKALDPNVQLSTLGCNELRVEQRVLFQIDFPNREIIGIKSRTSKSSGDVFGPLLAKYGYKLEHIVLQIANSSQTVTNDMPITRLDNQRVIVSISDDLEEWGWDCASSRLPVAVAGESRGGVGAGTPQLQRPPPLPPIRVLSDSLLEKSMDDDNDDDNDGDDCSSNHNNNADEKENLPVLMLTPAPLPQQALPNTPADSSRQMITAAAANNPSVTANISFSDDTKSEQFFRDLLLAAQHMPVQSPLKSSAKCQVPNIAAAPNHRLSSVNTKCLNSNNYGNTAIDPNNIAESMATSCESPSVTYSRHQTATADRPLPLPPPHIINDIDLDATLRSIQLYHNLRQNSDKTHSHSQQMTGSSPIDCRLNTSVPNFTPPQPPVRTTIMPAAMTKHYKPISGGGGLQLAPPLPPKPSDIVRGERGPPPPRPPSSRQSIYTVVANNGGVGTAAAPANNMSTLIKNLDKTIESNVIFV